MGQNVNYEISFTEVEKLISDGRLEIKNPDALQVLKSLLDYPLLMPTLRLRVKLTNQEYLLKWFETYNHGYDTRPSKKIGNASSTKPDELIKVLLQLHLGIDSVDASRIETGHSIMMTLENLVGELLEEYLSIRLKPYGWYCAWGSTIKAVDFCHPTYGMLQVKNSDNSENSSSSSVRDGTDIQKWFRRFSTKKGEYNWLALSKLTGCKILSEADFRDFCAELILKNPKVIASPL